MRDLAAGQGFTSAKAGRAVVLLGLGYRARAPVPGEDPAVSGLRLALLAAVALMRRRQIRVGSPRRYFPAFLIAEAALALGRHTRPSLMDRRNDAAFGIDAAGTTFAKYEPQVLRELAVILLSYRDDPPALDERLAPAEPDDDLGTESWSIPSHDRLVYIDRRGVFTGYSRRAEVESKIDGLRAVSFWTEYYADTRQGVIEAVRASNASILRQADEGGAHVTELALDPALGKGERRRIGVDVVFHTDVRGVPRIRCSAISDVVRATIAVQFDIAYRPEAVWYWNQVGLGREFAPSASRLVQVQPNGYVEFTFRGVRIGTTYGLSWEWPGG